MSTAEAEAQSTIQGIARARECPASEFAAVVGSTETEAAPVETGADPALTARTTTDLDRPWIVLVWNDPVNLMQYVTLVFQKLFGYDKTKATRLMLDVHEKGKAVVSSGPRERCEFHVAQLHEHGLWATMQQDD